MVANECLQPPKDTALFIVYSRENHEELRAGRHLDADGVGARQRALMQKPFIYFPVLINGRSPQAAIRVYRDNPEYARSRRSQDDRRRIEQFFQPDW
jgi:hypothetical protein